LKSSEGGPLLITNDVHKSFCGVVAVDVDHLSIHRQQITALIGPNGAGKTTYFDVITGFVKGDRGSVEFGGLDISNKPSHAIAQAGLVRTFQLTRALSRLTVLENMMLAPPGQVGEHVGHTFFWRGDIRRQEAENRATAMDLLDRFSIAHLADDYAGRLSGGQKKLLELARALMTQPTMVLLDEPMAGVNPTLGEQLLRYVLELRDEGLSFLFVEHDMDVVMRIAERVVVMATGAIIADGSPDEVRADPNVVTAYLGEHAEEDIEEAERRAEARRRERDQAGDG
jgi:branched-chain amino acid transport system ATP-binding protein